MTERLRLPTRSQINALTDPEVLADLRDAVERVAVKITTDLQFSADEEWARRARGALAAHRHARTLLERRLAALRAETPDANPRGRDDNDPLTNEVLDNRPHVDVAAISTVEAADEWIGWIRDRLDAVQRDREDEIGLPAAERDEAFMSATGSVLRRLRGLRQDVQNRRGELTRLDRQTAQRALQSSREQLFIDLCRETLDRETYRSLRARVDEIETRSGA